MKLMKAFTFAIVFLIFACGDVVSQSFWHNPYKDLEGNFVTMNEIKGEKYTVIDFWATWCKPCIKSIPEIVKMNNDYLDQGIVFIGVDVDSPRNLAKVRPFALSKGINYPVLLDTEQELMTALNVSVLPTFVILDPKGRRVYTHEGFVIGEEKALRLQIEKLLAGEE